MIDINISAVDNATLVEVSGRVDSMNANELGVALADEIDRGGINVVLDLAGVDYMSSAGLREIVSSLKKVKRLNGDLRIAQPSDRVLEIFEMAGLDTILQIFSSQREAVGSF